MRKILRINDHPTQKVRWPDLSGGIPPHKARAEKPRDPSPKVLALDPGTRHTGYVLLRGEKLVTGGVWKLGNGSAAPHAETVANTLRALLLDLLPDELVLEWPSPVPEGRRGTKCRTLRRLHRIARTMEAVGGELEIAVFRYEPTEIRRVVVGNGWATKEDVARFLAFAYPELAIHLKQDRRWKEIHWRHMFDALAAGRCHLAMHWQQKSSRGQNGVSDMFPQRPPKRNQSDQGQ